MNTDIDLAVFVQGALIVAFIAALAVFFQDQTREPYSDPWFIPILFVMTWWSLKGYSNKSQM